MKTNTVSSPAQAAQTSANKLPALPAGWFIRGEFMTSEDRVDRFVLDAGGRIDRMKVSTVLSNYGHETHANAWKHGQQSEGEAVNAELLAACQGLLRLLELLNAPGTNDPIESAVFKARAAIARATGGEKGGSL